MDFNKEFELYRKLETVLFRYFKIAEYLEQTLKISIKTKEPMSTILNPLGYDNSYTRGMKHFNETIYIPFNPFYLNDEEKQIFLQMFPNKFWETEANERNTRKTLLEIWGRIYEIKIWLGIIPQRIKYFNRREVYESDFNGIKKESRLSTVLQKYLRSNIKEFRWDFEHAIFRNVSKYTIKTFLNVIKSKRKGIISVT